MINKLDYEQIAELMLEDRKDNIALVFQERQYPRVLFKIEVPDMNIEYYEENPHMLWDAVRLEACSIANDYVQEPTATAPREREKREEQTFAWYNMVVNAQGIQVITLALGASAQSGFGSPVIIHQESHYGQAWLMANQALKDRVIAEDGKQFEDKEEHEFEGLKGY